MGEKWTNTHGTIEAVPERSVTRERVALVYTGRLSTEAYDARCALIATAPAMAEALKHMAALKAVTNSAANVKTIWQVAQTAAALLRLARGEPSPNEARTALNADQASGRE